MRGVYMEEAGGCALDSSPLPSLSPSSPSPPHICSLSKNPPLLSEFKKLYDAITTFKQSELM